MAATVTALYRYPVKGFTPEPREHLDVLATGRIAGDRVLAFLLGDAPAEPPQLIEGEGWWPKTNMLALVNTPALARLTLRWDEGARRMVITEGSHVLVDATLDDAGRARAAETIGAWAAAQDEQPDLGRPGRLPLRLIGDGVTARYQDGALGRVSLHGRGSLAALGRALEDDDLDERRFRSNIVLDGTAPWEELGWAGGVIRIGAVTFDVLAPAKRCLATHASPTEGVRDREVLTTLVREFQQDAPSFAIMMLPREGGSVRLGDEVSVIGTAPADRG
jgi:uncharacterized protein YcbX